MKAIKFVSADNQQKQFGAAVRRNVNNYFREKGISTKGNVPMLLQTISMLLMYISPLILVLTVGMNVWIALILVVIMGVGKAGIGMCVMHDALHGSYSNKEWANKVFGSTMYLLGSNVFNWKIQHNMLHHTYTNIDGLDHDISGQGPIRLSESAPLHWIHRYQHIHAFFFYGLLTLSKLGQDFVQLVKYTKAGITKKHRITPSLEFTKMAIAKLIYLFAFIGLPLLVTPFTWWEVLLGFFIMHWTAGSILSTIFQLAHIVEGVEQPLPNAEGIIESDWAVHEMLSTADFARNNLLLNWYIGGLNFQIEHHLFPNICHVHYRKIAPIVERTAKEFGIPYNLKPTLMNAIFSHIRKLKQLGRPLSNNAA